MSWLNGDYVLLLRVLLSWAKEMDRELDFRVPLHLKLISRVVTDTRTQPRLLTFDLSLYVIVVVGRSRRRTWSVRMRTCVVLVSMCWCPYPWTR
jgi:hypothetical protein